jgi:hypothetical protein
MEYESGFLGQLALREPTFDPCVAKKKTIQKKKRKKKEEKGGRCTFVHCVFTMWYNSEKNVVMNCCYNPISNQV